MFGRQKAKYVSGPKQEYRGLLVVDHVFPFSLSAGAMAVALIARAAFSQAPSEVRCHPRGSV